MKRAAFTMALIGFILCNIYAQENKIKVVKAKDEKKAHIQIKKDENITLIVNEKEYDSEIIDFIDPNIIENISVFKGESAQALYGKEKVIVIKTKLKSEGFSYEVQSDTLNANLNVQIREGEENPVVVIDGILRQNGSLNEISPDDIESVSIAKDPETMKEYNTTAGVIFITTKKKQE